MTSNRYLQQERSAWRNQSMKPYLVQSRTMPIAEIRARLDRAGVGIRDARYPRLSVPRRFSCAYDSARDTALAFSGAMNEKVTLGENRRLETFQYLIMLLKLGERFSSRTQKMVQYHRLESRLFYAGKTCITDTVVRESIDWAEEMHHAVIERLRSSAQAFTLDSNTAEPDAGSD